MKAETGIAEALKLGTKSFGMLNTGRGNLEASKATISILILNLLDFFTAEWNITQLDDCVEIIATDYHWLSQAEFKIFTLRCKKGVFGPDYGKLSPQRLLIWLEEFSQVCLFERAGVHPSVSKDSKQKLVANLFDGSNLLAELREKLISQAKLEADDKAKHQDENIRKHQLQIRERWRSLETQKRDNNSKKCSVSTVDKSTEQMI